MSSSLVSKRDIHAKARIRQICFCTRSRVYRSKTILTRCLGLALPMSTLLSKFTLQMCPLDSSKIPKKHGVPALWQIGSTPGWPVNYTCSRMVDAMDGQLTHMHRHPWAPTALTHQPSTIDHNKQATTDRRLTTTLK